MPHTGIIGLGMVSVVGLIRVPKPPAKITAWKSSFGILTSFERGALAWEEDASPLTGDVASGGYRGWVTFES